MKKLSISILLILLILTGCFNKKGNTIYLNLFSNPEKIDTGNFKDSAENLLVYHMFEGLTIEDSTGEIVPAVAESWSIVGNVWTFNINSNAKWHNGEKVKAEDFVVAWERILNQKNNNKSAESFFMIKGAMEYNEGSIIDFKSVGIKALNDSVLQVELKEPNPNFDSIVAQIIFYPINKKFYEKNKEEYGLSKKYILGNGPYELDKWTKGKEIVLKKYKKYRAADNINIKNIDILINGNTAQLKELYEKNKLDILNFTLDEMPDYRKSKDMKSFGTGDVTYIQFNTKNNMFSNKKIRKAISMSINRNAFIELLQRTRAEKAESLIPKNIFGVKKTFRDENRQEEYKIGYNPLGAKVLFKEGLNEMGKNLSNFKNISLLVGSNETEIKMANFIKSQLRENLNLDIEIKAETAQMRSQMLGMGNYDFIINTYSSNIVNINNYFKCWSFNNYKNITGWSSGNYDNLIKGAMLEKDSKKRTEKFAEAEKILMDELPIIPLSFSKKTFIIKDRLEGVTLSNVSKELNFKYANVKK